jgi:hypothetical protein
MEDRGPAVVGCGHRPSVAGRTASGKTGLAERTHDSAAVGVRSADADRSLAGEETVLTLER